MFRHRIDAGSGCACFVSDTPGGPDANFRCSLSNKESCMNKIQKLTGIAIAAAAAGVFSTVTVGSAFAADEAKVHCAGVNACKGQNDCKGAKNACKGQGSC